MLGIQLTNHVHLVQVVVQLKVQNQLDAITAQEEEK
mgnify:FL=1